MTININSLHKDILNEIVKNFLPEEALPLRFVKLFALLPSMHAQSIKQKPLNKDRVIASVIRRCSLPFVDWLIDILACDLFSIRNHAARTGRIDILETLFKRSSAWCKRIDVTPCQKAAEGGQLEALSWLVQKGFPVDENRMICEAYYTAAAEGDVAKLQSMRSVRWPDLAEPRLRKHFYDTMRLRAISSGKLEMLNWLHEQGFVLDGTLSFYIVVGGNVKMLEWLYSKQYRLSSDHILCAERKGNSDAVTWLRAHLLKVDQA